MYQPRTPFYGSGPTTPSPAHHVQHPYSPDSRMFRPTSPSPAHHVQHQYSPEPRMYQQPQAPYYNLGPRNFPAHQGQSGPRNSPAHQGQSGNFTRPPFHNPNIRSPSSSYSPNSGRGRGHSGLGRGGNRGSGSRGRVSAEHRPDLYYNKLMVGDPWKNLEPTIWKSEDVSVRVFNNSRKSLHSDSLSTKKARVSVAAEDSGSQPSLAEYIAAAFNETVGEKGDESNLIM